jgi:hypothetical protein
MSDDRELPRIILKAPGYLKVFAGIYFLLCLVMAVGFLLVVLRGFPGAVNPASRAAEATGFGLVIVMDLALFFWFVYPRALSRYFVFPDRFEIHRGKKITRFRYAEIAKIYGLPFPYFFGLIGNLCFIRTDGQFANISAATVDAEILLDAIAEFTPSRKAEFIELRANLVTVRHGFARFFEYFKGRRALFTLIHLVAIPTGFTLYLVARQKQIMVIADPKTFFYHAALGVAFAVVPLGFFSAMVLNRVIDAPTSARLRSAPRDTARDLEREGRVFRNAFPVYLFALFSVLGLYNRYDLNALGLTRVSADIPHLGYRAGEKVWIDGRANCFRCQNSVRDGDVIQFSGLDGLHLGKLVATPGELADVTVGPEAGRALASNPVSNPVTVPAGKIAVRRGSRGVRVELIDTADLRGKVFENLGAYLRSR